MEIRKVKNGYIVTNKYDMEEIHTTLESVFAYMLSHFEGRAEFFRGESFGVVEIHRKPNDKFKEAEPV